MKPGDYLLIQFGINDSDSTCPRHVGINAFESSYEMMAKAATDRGAHPVFITPTSSISCSGSTAVATRGSYVPATKTAGTQAGAPVIDLNALTVSLYNAMKFCPVPGGDVSASTTGPVGDFFCDDHTHFSASGAPQIAALVAQAIRSQSLPLAAYLK
jgi:lysophospholipase L1-like esterase